MSSHSSRVGCARCGAPPGGGPLEPTRTATADTAAAELHPTRQARPTDRWATSDGPVGRQFSELDDWDFEETMLHAKQLVERVQRDLEMTGGPVTRPTTASAPRSDATETDAVGPASTTARPPAQPSNTLPWLILTIGLGVFVCGAALTGMALTKSSTPLWQLGLPMLLGGQLAILSVVIWQLDAVWHSHRATFVALHAVDDQVRQLRVQTDSMSGDTKHGSSLLHRGQDRAQPRVLFTDLHPEFGPLARHRGTAHDAA